MANRKKKKISEKFEIDYSTPFRGSMGLKIEKQWLYFVFSIIIIRKILKLQ